MSLFPLSLNSDLLLPKGSSTEVTLRLSPEDLVGVKKGTERLRAASPRSIILRPEFSTKGFSLLVSEVQASPYEIKALLWNFSDSDLNIRSTLPLLYIGLTEGQ